MNCQQKIKMIKPAGSESGAVIIMVYLAILMFLFIAILFLDIPYLERMGRSMQKAVDAASLAGVIQLTGKNIASNTAPNNNIDRITAWRRAKRAAFAVLAANEIAAAPGIVTSASATTAKLGTQDPLDLTDYGYETYTVSNGTQTGTLVISRGVYERPLPVYPIPEVFYSLEVGANNRGGTGDAADDNNCVAKPLNDPAALPSVCNPLTDPSKNIFDINYRLCSLPPYSACLSTAILFDSTLNVPPGYTSSGAISGLPPNGSPPVWYVADSMRVSLTIDNVPTLFAKLVGINSYTAITRAATSGPM